MQNHLNKLKKEMQYFKKEINKVKKFIFVFYKNDSDSSESTESQLCNPMYLTAA